MEQLTELLIKAEKKTSFSKGVLIGFSLSSIVFVTLIMLLLYK